MIYLVLSILCSSSIFILFKYFEKYRVTTFLAIVINYLIASTTGILSLNGIPEWTEIASKTWLPNALFLGFLFITLFYIMAITSQRLGPSVASIANKMALVVPVIYAVIYYDDALNLLKVVGIILALVGIYLASIKPKTQQAGFDKKLLLVPVLLFIGSGFIDTFIKYNQEYHLAGSTREANAFSALIFSTAFCLGIIILIIRFKHLKWNKQSLIGGILLGIINYGSIYFLIQALNHSSFESSIVFPINNMGVVILTSTASFLIFRERFSSRNKWGVLIALVSIACIALSGL
jgi:drug/metabolite transporter (DMT)-like permease